MRSLLVAGAMAVTIVAASAREQAAHVVIQAPSVTGPIANTTPLRSLEHGYPYNATPVDLAKHGYVEEEFLISGLANRYNTPAGERGSILVTGSPSSSSDCFVRYCWACW